METILVTGGAGFIGSNFIHYYLAQHPNDRVINLDKLTYAGNPANLDSVADDPRYHFVQGDICAGQTVRDLMQQADRVVNFAAETHVDRSIVSAGDFITTDVFGTYVLLEAARDANVRRFVQISTDEVYGEAGDTPSTEQSLLNPCSPYAASKAGADRLAYSYFITYGMPVVVSRCGNNYGPYQYPEKLIPFFITNALQDKPLPLYGDGQNVRDWIHAVDHCRAIDLLLHEPAIEGDVFNVSSRQEMSNIDITRMILQELGKPDSLIKPVADRLGHVRRHAVNSTKIETRLGWQPSIAFEKGLQQTVQWYRDNETWWRAIWDKSEEFKKFHQEYYKDR